MLIRYAVGFLLALFLFLYSLTWRVEVKGSLPGKNSVIFLFHQNFLVLIYFGILLSPLVLISRSKDGDFLAGALFFFGGKAIRGSSSRGASQSLIKLIKEKIKKPLVFAVDGPRGPAYKVKPGADFVAEKTGRVRIGTFFEVSSFWELSSWDKTRIPKPFSKITACFFEIKGSSEAALLNVSNSIEE